MQQTQPTYAAAALARIRVPVMVVHSEHDEFFKRAHAVYLAQSMPGAELRILEGVSHVAPLQRPEHFTSEVLAFLDKVLS